MCQYLKAAGSNPWYIKTRVGNTEEGAETPLKLLHMFEYSLHLYEIR